VIQTKNNASVSMWTKRSHIASIEVLTCLTREDIDQRAYKRSGVYAFDITVVTEKFSLRCHNPLHVACGCGQEQVGTSMAPS
jgi:hypothetical protein